MSFDARHCKRCGGLFVVTTKSRKLTCSERCKALLEGKSWCDEAGVVRVDSGTYWKLYLPDHPNANKQGYVYEHVYVASKKIGRPIMLHENVHHEDENKRNNHPDNLHVITAQEHHREHGGWKLFAGRWHKPCARCQKMLPASLDHFFPRNSEGTLLSSYCRKCTNEKRRADRAAQSIAEDGHATSDEPDQHGRPDGGGGEDRPREGEEPGTGRT